MTDKELVDYVVQLSTQYTRWVSEVWADEGPKPFKKRLSEAGVLQSNLAAELRQLLREAGRLS